MALVLKDRVKETSSTTGTGTITLNGAVTGFQSFAAIGNGNTTYYTISDSSSGSWEVGIGTYTSSGTTLSRTTVLASSNSGSLVNFTAGTKDVFVTYPSSRSIYADGTTLVATNSSILPTTSGGTGLSTLTAGYIPFGAGTSAFNSSANLFWDSANFRLGIGTASPGYKVTVAGTSGSAVVSLLETGVRSWGIRAGGTATNTFDIADFTASATRLTIDSSGNVTIGTSTNTNTSKLVSSGTISQTVGGTQYLVVDQSDIGTGANEIPLNQYLGKMAYKDVVGMAATLNPAPTIASAATIQPLTPIVFVSGTTTINTITVPAEFVGGGQITLIPTGLWSTGTSGNIAIATTGVVSKALILTYDATTAKWYPSY